MQIFGMLLDFRKTKNTRIAARVFLRFSTVSQHPRVFGSRYPNTENHYRYFFSLTFRALALGQRETGTKLKKGQMLETLDYTTVLALLRLISIIPVIRKF